MKSAESAAVKKSGPPQRRRRARKKRTRPCARKMGAASGNPWQPTAVARCFKTTCRF